MHAQTRHALIALVWLVGAPAAVHAQASITGVVRDTSGAVLPGVTVEAASPALIEKVRTVVSDGTGQYRVVDLPPGTYVVTFALPGFNTIKREGLELTGNFTAAVNAEMRVGALEETITVTGETPVVDIQSARQQQTISHDAIAAIPTGGAFQHLATLIPAMVSQGGMAGGSQDVGGDRGPVSASDRYFVHGGILTDSRIMVDGLGAASPDGGGASGTYYMPPVRVASEVAITTSGGMGEAETSGVLVNVIMPQGGNRLTGSFFGTFASSSMQSSNYTQELKDRGLRAPNRVERNYDINPAVGGPIARDRLWFFAYGRRMVANNYIAGMFHNKNAGNPNTWTYEPDLSRQAIDYSWAWSTALRLTLQATPRNKFNIFWDEQPLCRGCPGGSATLSPEAKVFFNGGPHRLQLVTWTSPLTNRILLDAGFNNYTLLANWKNEPPEVPELIGVTEQAGAIPGLTYRGLIFNRPSDFAKNWRGSITYVTGAHSTKVGYQGTWYYRTANNDLTQNGGFSYRFNNGVPNQLTQSIVPVKSIAQYWVHAAYAQDQWTVEKLTLQGAVRYDYFGSNFPEQRVGPDARYLAVPIVFPNHSVARFHDVTPRMGTAYDLFGNGKTALKVHAGKYVVGQESTSTGTFGWPAGPIVRLATGTNRSWNDVNRNFVPDCDLANPANNGECGAMANQNFAKNVFSVTYDPAVTRGWGVRPYSWEFAMSVQQELLPRVAIEVGYFRRWYGNFAVTDNLATAAADYTTFKLPVPVDAQLPNSGGTVTVSDLNPAKFGAVNNVVTAASNYGKQVKRWNGVDASVNVRPQNGLFLQGGFSVGRTLTDNCEVVEKLPEVRLGANTANVWTPHEYCHVEQGFETQVKALAGYTIPRIDVQVSGTFQNKPGPEILANYNAPNAVIAPVLGRNLSGGAANMTVNLLPPLSTFADRITQLDLRVGKIFRFGRSRAQLTLDLFNALNSNVPQTHNNTFGPRWQTPTLIMTARLAKVAMQFDF